MSSFPTPPGSSLAPTRVLLVTYDLKTVGKNYTPFYDALKLQGTWWHYLSSAWLIATPNTPQILYTAVAPHLTSSDFILILPVTRPYWGILPKDAWDWIETHLPKP